MGGKRILYVSSEFSPYFKDSSLGKSALNTTKSMHQKGNDVRVFVPKYGCINDRRFQLHEVIRLSGVNLIINDMDQPLIIKVASVPEERFQAYFIDNDEYFKRKGVYVDEQSGVFFEDNDERCMFFCKGVLETIKKLNWSPDVIHIFGWMGALIPTYLKQHYSDEPIFENTRIFVSLHNQDFNQKLSSEFPRKLALDGLVFEDELEGPTLCKLMKMATDVADVVIKEEQISKKIEQVVLGPKISSIFESDKMPVVDLYAHCFDSLEKALRN